VRKSVQQELVDNMKDAQKYLMDAMLNIKNAKANFAKSDIDQGNAERSEAEKNMRRAVLIMQAQVGTGLMRPGQPGHDPDIMRGPYLQKGRSFEPMNEEEASFDEAIHKRSRSPASRMFSVVPHRRGEPFTPSYKDETFTDSD
jgi:hypothetical protein